MQANENIVIEDVDKILEDENDWDGSGRTREEFARSLRSSFKELVPIMLGKEKAVDNFDEKLAEWRKLAREVELEEEQKMQPNKNTATLEKIDEIEETEQFEEDENDWDGSGRTREEFARSLRSSFKSFIPVLLGKEKAVNNTKEFLAELEQLAKEVEEREAAKNAGKQRSI